MPFQEGNTYGKGAPPKERRFADKLEKILSEEVKQIKKDAADATTVEEYEEAITRLDRVAERLVTIAETAEDKHAIAAINSIADRLDGKAKQTTELTGPNGLPLLAKLEDMTDEQLEAFITGRTGTESSSQADSQPAA